MTRIEKAVRKPQRALRYDKRPAASRRARIVEHTQLYLIDEVQRDSGVATPRPPVNRYRENGGRHKLLGAVYTPPEVAAILTRWAVRSANDSVLDPACGEGVFLSAARTRLADLGARRFNCLGVDIDPEIAVKVGFVCADFFRWVKTAQPVDVIVGNPPFIRSHLFPEESRALAFAEMAKMGLRPSRLMSTWVPFLAVCSRLLKKDGRLAMVVPEELLHVGYAEELRRFLLSRFRRVVVCFPARGIFAEVQAAVVLLLCDNEIGGPSGLLTMDYSALEQGDMHAVEPAKPWDWNRKWTHLFLAPRNRQLLDDLQGRMKWQPFHAYGRVEVGVVTGDNDFFILSRRQIAGVDANHLVPIVTSAKDLRGIRFGVEDFRQIVSQNRPAFLLKATEAYDELPAHVRAYVASGEARQVHARYKCRIREPWYAVPSVWECDALLLRQAGVLPRLVHLSRKCTATDTIHRVRWKTPSLGRRHAVSFLNTITLLWAELTGRSYGGGVLELMPSEANKLPLPDPVVTLDAVFDVVDERVRSRMFHEAVSLVDDVVLPGWLSAGEREAASEALTALVRRRSSIDNVHN